jgi:hypothetical protein
MTTTRDTDRLKAVFSAAGEVTKVTMKRKLGDFCIICHDAVPFAFECKDFAFGDDFCSATICGCCIDKQKYFKCPQCRNIWSTSVQNLARNQARGYCSIHGCLNEITFENKWKYPEHTLCDKHLESKCVVVGCMIGKLDPFKFCAEHNSLCYENKEVIERYFEMGDRLPCYLPTLQIKCVVCSKISNNTQALTKAYVEAEYLLERDYEDNGVVDGVCLAEYCLYQMPWCWYRGHRSTCSSCHRCLGNTPSSSALGPLYDKKCMIQDCDWPAEKCLWHSVKSCSGNAFCEGHYHEIKDIKPHFQDWLNVLPKNEMIFFSKDLQ